MELSTPSEDLKRLQRCMSDLISVLALPAVWSGQGPRQIVTTFHEALMAMLNLDLLYMRVTYEACGEPIELMRIAPFAEAAQNANEIREILQSHFGADPRKWATEVRSRLDGQETSLSTMRLGLDGEIGIVVAGSNRADFPTESERLLLGVAANQVTVGLQQARLLSEQKRIADELDQRVAERTRKLAETNEELQLQVGLLQHLPASAWTLKPDGTPDFVNQVWLEFSGQSLDFVRSNPEAWMTAVHPEDREAALRAFRVGIQSGQGFAFETRSLRARDGTYRWHLQQAVALRDGEGKVIRFVGTTTDIDDQKHAQEELRASEGKLKRVIDTIPSLSWCNLPDGPNEFLSKGWHEYTGLSPEEAHGWGWSAAFHPDDLPPLMKRWQELLVSGESGEIEARIRRHDGEYRWFLIRVAPYRDEAGVIVRWYGTSTDIHDRKRSEEALRESEQSFRLIVDGIAGLVAIMSPTGEIETVNRQVLAYFGKTVEELKGWSTSDAVHPEDMPAVISAWTRSLETGTVYDVDHRLRRLDGAYRWFHARGLPLVDDAGRVLRWYVLLTDIDDRKKVEEALTRAREELAHMTKVTSLGVLTASIAHEVNQPLSGIVTNASTCLRMLDSDPPNIDGARETARRIIRDGNRAADVVTRLRALFKKRDLVTDWVDLSDAAREVMALSSNELQGRGVVLKDELADGLPPVRGDRVQLQQVILNLIRNAAEAMSTVFNRPRQLLIRTESPDGDHVSLIVRDSGVGFDPLMGDQLFESFYTTKDNGMGIGLSVSRSIIAAHHGRIWAAPNDGPGSTFAFSIPRRPVGKRAEEAQSRVESDRY